MKNAVTLLIDYSVLPNVTERIFYKDSLPDKGMIKTFKIDNGM